jgi:glycosyltransferase involved in cell wall biosynthesis
MKAQAKEWFSQYYRQALSRFCVSPGMEEKYRLMTGVQGTVLYPSRSSNCPAYAVPPSRLAKEVKQPTVVFAGTINGPGYIRALREMAEILIPLQGRLIIYGPLTKGQAKEAGLELPNVELGGLLQSDHLISRLRDEADLLYVPMSFSEKDRGNMEVSFPSKLTDYTACGVPLLIRGPGYCSAIRWVRENPGVAATVENEDRALLAQAVERIFRSVPSREKLAVIALQKGQEYFAHTTATQKFLSSFQ